MIPTAVEVDPEHVLVRSNGQVGDSLNLSYSEHDVGRMRTGYVCIYCKEDLDTAFPDLCPICGFPMREKQAERFAKEFQGEVWVGPTTTVEEELAIAEELWQKEREKIAKPSIIVPRSI